MIYGAAQHLSSSLRVAPWRQAALCVAPDPSHAQTIQYLHLLLLLPSASSHGGIALLIDSACPINTNVCHSLLACRGSESREQVEVHCSHHQGSPNGCCSPSPACSGDNWVGAPFVPAHILSLSKVSPAPDQQSCWCGHSWTSCVQPISVQSLSLAVISSFSHS